MYKDIEHIITLVTPYVGVWIETTCAQSYPTVILVTPYVGVTSIQNRMQKASFVSIHTPT